jgi:hypothetical protein
LFYVYIELPFIKHQAFFLFSCLGNLDETLHRCFHLGFQSNPIFCMAAPWLTVAGSAIQKANIKTKILA